jgi:hypothetical protein
MSLLSHLTLSRGIIIGSFLGSGVVGFLLYRDQVRLENYQAAIDAAPNVVPVLVNKAQELEDLMKATAREEFGASVNALETYIYERAANPKVHIGQVDIAKPIEKIIAPARQSAPGVRDIIYGIEPSTTPKREYTRGEVSNFAYLLEQDSRRVKVTGLELTPTDKSPKPDKFLSDRWNFKLEVRVREKFDAPAGG